jgi:hypothetical protein
LQWYELTAAASGWITTHALLALAAEPFVGEDDARSTHAAYFPHTAMTLTMLDSWADREADERTGDHSYVAHYPTLGYAAARLCASIDRSATAPGLMSHVPCGKRAGPSSVPLRRVAWRITAAGVDFPETPLGRDFARRRPHFDRRGTRSSARCAGGRCPRPRAPASGPQRTRTASVSPPIRSA